MGQRYGVHLLYREDSGERGIMFARSLEISFSLGLGPLIQIRIWMRDKMARCHGKLTQ